MQRAGDTGSVRQEQTSERQTKMRTTMIEMHGFAVSSLTLTLTDWHDPRFQLSSSHLLPPTLAPSILRARCHLQCYTVFRYTPFWFFQSLPLSIPSHPTPPHPALSKFRLNEFARGEWRESSML